MNDALEKPLPHNAEAEQAILGGIILNNDLLDQAAQLLTKTDFYAPTNQRVFAAMLLLADAKKPIDPLLIAEELKSDGLLESVGGVTAISNLTYGCPHFANIREYVQLVKECAEARNLIKVCNSTIADLMDDYRNAPRLENRLVTLAQAREQADSPASIGESVDSTLSLLGKWRSGEITAVPTGIPELADKLVAGGWYPQEINMIAARTSVGKTAFTLQASASAARAGVPALIFSLEMNKEALLFRIASSLTGIPLHYFSPKSFKYGPREELFEAIESLRDLPLYLGDKTQDLTRIVANSRHWVRNYGVKLITVDYIGLVGTYGTGRRFGNTAEKLGYVMDTFKNDICLELDVPLLLPVQINRVSLGEKRRPEAHDLKGSGDQEQTAHNVFIIYTPQGTVQDDENIRKVNLYCPKQRNGPRDWELPMDYNVIHQTFWTPRMTAAAQLELTTQDLQEEATSKMWWDN